MPTGYPPSSFESLVGNFLNSYGAVKGIKAQSQEAADRKRAADNADREAQMREQAQGYTRITTPTVGTPPDQGFVASVGNFLSNHFGSGQPEPSTILMKTGPSAADEAAARNEAFITSRDTAHFQNEKDIEQLKAAIEASRTDKVIAAENTRSAGNNATAVRVAGIDHDVEAQALADRQRTEFFDSAVAAAGGDPIKAMSNVEQYQMPQAQKFRASRADYYAAAARRNAPSEELKKARAELDLQRAGQIGSAVSPMLPRDLNGKPIPPPPPAAALPSSASSSQTMRAPLKPVDLAHAKREPGFKAWLMQQGYTQQELGF